MKFSTLNPSTNQVIEEYSYSSLHDSKQKIFSIDKGFVKWKKTNFSERSAIFYSVAQLLREKKEHFSRLMAIEMGKPLLQGIAEVEKCAATCEYYAKNAESFLQPQSIPTEAYYSGVVCNPLGTIFAIMPWNFPLWQVIRFLAPTLMAGNTAILKHAVNVTGCALALEQCLYEAGLPDDVFAVVLCDHPTAESIIGMREIAAVSLTGSTRAGKRIGEIAGKHIKKCVLELGGSDAYIICADADIDYAVEQCVQSRLINTGQSCIAAKRFIVVPEIADEFTEKFATQLSQKTYGNPLEGIYDCGPMARHDLRDELHTQVQQSVQQGAQCIIGGYIPENEGAFYPPTLLTHVNENMPAYHEELFGPVATIIRAIDENHAIEIANSTSFGLGGGIFTEDRERGKYIAEYLFQSGACFVNTFTKSDPRLPFGGIKESGYGRELSHFGIMEFVNSKTVWVQ